MGTLYDKLKTYEASDYYAFHMPGHKRNTERFQAELPYGIDITEIDGFDDLHHAEGILKEAEERASGLYKAEETHFPGKWQYGGNFKRYSWDNEQGR